MNSQGNGQPLRYSVHLAGITKAEIKNLHVQARADGRSKRFLRALRRIIEQLQSQPLVFGEPLYRLPALKLLICQAVVDIVAVYYAVHDERPIVFVHALKVLS
jgi:hypothetical protein